MTINNRPVHLYAARLGSALVLSAFMSCAQALAGPDCANDKHVVEACFDVHGRISVHANSRVYLWPVGTRRIYGIEYPPDLRLPDLPLPGNVDRAVFTPTKSGIGVDVFGDFRVCPFTHDEPGKMRFVCIDSATHLRTELRNRRPEN